MKNSTIFELILPIRLKKDLKLAMKHCYSLNLLNEHVEILQKEEPLPGKNRDHSLTGGYNGFRECHIQPDWLLVYRVDGEELLLFLSRTGTHSDLFG